MDSEKFISTGMKEIDDLLGGGLRRRTVVLVMGPPEGGKSYLALEWILGFSKDVHPVLFGTVEIKEELESMRKNNHPASVVIFDGFDTKCSDIELLGIHARAANCCVVALICSGAISSRQENLRAEHCADLVLYTKKTQDKKGFMVRLEKNRFGRASGSAYVSSPPPPDAVKP